MAQSTGVEALDTILRGGLPDRRTTLLTGTPGTGKSTLAMEFLQAGIDADQECLYVSTEQTINEIRDSMSPYAFALGDESLTITSIQARPGTGDEQLGEHGISKQFGARDDDAPQFILRTLEGNKKIDNHRIQFTPDNIRQYLKAQGDYDRVVVDSLSGLRTLSGDINQYRRSVLELIQLINAQMDATALFTAESTGFESGSQGSEQLALEDFIQYTVHGVIRLWRERVRGDYRRFLDVMKMRGVAHDTRQFEFTFDSEGVRVISHSQTYDANFLGTSFLPTGIDGLDDVLGGGFQRGGSVLLEHDGQANIEVFLSAALSNALDEQLSIALMPRVDTPPQFLSSLFERLGVSMEELLNHDQLFILDALGAWDDHENVFDLHADAQLKSSVSEIYDSARGNGLLLTTNTEAMIHSAGIDPTREFRYWLQAQRLRSDDLLLEVHNPALMDDTNAAFFEDSASQGLETWLSESGLQYVRLKKGRTGEIGSLRVLEYIDDIPFVRAVE